MYDIRNQSSIGNLKFPRALLVGDSNAREKLSWMPSKTFNIILTISFTFRHRIIINLSD